MKLIYGLANRCYKYGIKQTCSYDQMTSLSELIDLGVCAFDGAERYGWRLDDLNYFRSHTHLEVSTKISLSCLEQNQCPSAIGHSFLQHLDGVNIKIIYMHDPISDTFLQRFQLLLGCDEKMRNFAWGLSIYTQYDVDLIAKWKPPCKFIQAPLNPLTRLRLDRLTELGYTVIVRSIFLQGLYFVQSTSIPGGINHLKFERHAALIQQYASKLGISCGQALFSFALVKAKRLKCDGVVIGGSATQRIKTYIDSHEYVSAQISVEYIDSLWYDEEFSDPRLWSQLP